MTLKSIELAGFKSFGKKSALSFLTPVTAIVGPNGSGKSNIVESIRFVLGEQSMKSLRGKGGVDLIFKGSKALSSMNRAQVTIVFDNSKKIFSFTNSGLGVSLDYDEISISREVFADGANRYSINGTEVRLKDINDLLASVNIGSSGHHIISQGEADRVLNASNKDRRAMIEDALGLKVYQYRIKESERKFDRTLVNMKEVAAERREVAPHLTFLKKQVEKIEKARDMREELRQMYQTYVSAEATYIEQETTRLTHLRRTLDEQLVSFDDRISQLQSQKIDVPHESEHIIKIKQYEEELRVKRAVKDELARKLGRIEGTLESIERELARVPETKETLIPESQWRSIIADLTSKIDEALSASDMPEITRLLRAMKEQISAFSPAEVKNAHHIDEKIEQEHSDMKALREEMLSEARVIASTETALLESIQKERSLEKETEINLRDGERMLYELLGQKNEVTSSMHSLRFEEEKLGMIKTAFETELAEGGVLIGPDVMGYARKRVEGEIVRQVQDDLKRKIERIKIKLEDAGSGNGAEIMKEYEHTQERDAFLAKELDDITASIESLRLLIAELKETLDAQFKEGVAQINKQFQEFFALMFGGGSAFLSIVMEHKRPKKGEELDDESLSAIGSDGTGSEDNELGFERGIEINVTLPQKKVKDLHMLSGGERSLTSIALLFAISQVNPPPFLVLDETDAALDEANSRKYGNMLENLSKYSQLVVVTHNRETMSRAQVLYGVTMDASGASKLLSIKLEDASVYAK
jgi:chromosome segregation protein